MPYNMNNVEYRGFHLTGYDQIYNFEERVTLIPQTEGVGEINYMN